jgi:hypothetical protein
VRPLGLSRPSTRTSRQGAAGSRPRRIGVTKSVTRASDLLGEKLVVGCAGLLAGAGCQIAEPKPGSSGQGICRLGVGGRLGSGWQSPSSARIVTAHSSPIPVVRVDQRLAARLVACPGAQLAVKRGDLNGDRVDHLERDHDLLTRRPRQRLSLKPVAAVALHQPAPLRTAVVVEHRLDPLLPLGVLLDQRMAEPHPSAEIKCDRAGSTTPAAAQPATAHADAGRRRDRSWAASCSRAWRRSPPARPGEPPHRHAAAPRSETATR